MQIIRIDIFIGFGLYSILYVLITLFKKDIRLLETVDLNSARFIVFSGIIYFLSIIIWTVISVATLHDFDTGRTQFWWAPWLQSLLWILITQLFWIKKIRNVKILRVVIAILLIVSFEMYVIIVTSFHRDYVPEIWTTRAWTMFNWTTPSEIILGLTTKIVLFCLLSTLYVFIVDRIKLSVR
jgi:hypothetical protein